MSKFRVQFSDSVKIRTVESPKGPYKVCLEGYFDFNEALVKLMILNGDMLPRPSQFEPVADSDDDSDMEFSEPQFDDVCDAIELGREVASRLSEPSEPLKKVSKARKPEDDVVPSDDLPDGPLDPDAVAPNAL